MTQDLVQEQVVKKGEIQEREPKKISYSRKYPWLKAACPLSPDSALQQIAKFLTGLKSANPRVLCTKFYGDKPFARILKKWDKIAMPIRQKMGSEFVDDYKVWLKKAGPRSPRKSWMDVKEVYTGYFVPVLVKADAGEIDRAADFIDTYTGLAAYYGRLRPLSLEKALERLPKTTNWGMPFYLHGRVFEYESMTVNGTKVLTGKMKLVNDHLPMYLALAVAMANDPHHPGWSVPNLPFRRTDMKGPEIEDTSQRAVWGQPHAVSILDATIVGPITSLVQTIQAKGFHSIINEEVLTRRIHGMLRDADAAGRIVVGLDKDKWDHHVGRVWIDTGFAHIKKLFQVGAVPAYYENLIRYFSESGMLTPDGLLSGRKDNVSSGSGFTLWLNSYMHLVCLAYVYHRIYGTYEGFDAECKGDDGILSLEQTHLKMFVEITNTETGMVNSVEKQYAVPGSTSFAKKVYRLDIPAGVPPSSRTIASMKYMDMGVNPDLWTGYYESARWISQLNNYWDTPEFESLVAFAIEGDKYGLGTLLPGGVDELVRRAGGGLLLNRMLGIESYEGAYKDVDWREIDGLPIYGYLRGLTAERVA